jgi:hypothetical protein
MASRRRSRRKSIAGNITDVQKRLRYLETRPAPTQLASKVVVSKNIAPRAVGQELIADSAIARRSLTPGVIGTAQIEASSITQGLLATDSVGTDQLKPDSVTSSEIAGGAVGNTELAGGITDDKLTGISAGKVSGTIVTSQIGDLQVTDAKIAGISGSKIIGGVQGSLIVDGTVTGAKLSTGAVNTTQLADVAVTAGKIGIGAVTETKIGDGAIRTEKIFIQAVTGDKIQLNGVTTIRIGDQAVSAAKIADGNVTADKIQAGAVTTSKLAVGVISSSIYLGDSVVLDRSISGVSATKISGQITNAQLAGGITNGKISSVDAGTIITGTIGINRLPGEVLTNVSGGTGITVGGSGRSRTVSLTGGSFAPANHTHSQYATSGRYDSSFAGSHVGHGGHTHFTNVSTRKLKKEISDYSIDLDKLFLLQPKRFKYRNQARDASKNREWDYGYIAEEALELGVEEILGYDEKGEVDSINYGLLSVFVLELVKKQQNEINLLSEEIKRLKENK